MKNFKRVFTVSLASALLVGTMGISASALSFQDADEIENTEAVETLVALNVLNGRDNNEFDPEASVTRGEMAKILTVVLNGGKIPVLGNVTTSSYLDTLGHWSAAYVEYCTNRGVAAGDGLGYFSPEGDVNGFAAAKMLLVAIGYDANIEGLVGSNWTIATTVLGNQTGLFEGLEDLDLSAPLSRDDAAQMAYNALSAERVSYKYTLVPGANGSVTSVPSLEKQGETVLSDYFDVVAIEGVVVANEHANLGAGSTTEAGETRIEYVDELGATVTETFPVGTELSSLGKEVRLFVKFGTTSSGTTVVGSAVVTDNNSVIVDNSRDSLNEIADDHDLSLSGALVSTNYNEAVLADVLDFDQNGDDTKDAFEAADGEQGVQRILIDNNNDDVIDYVIYEDYRLAQIDNVKSDELTLSYESRTVDPTTGAVTYANAQQTWDEEDVLNFDDINEDDVVLFAEIGGKLHVQEAETVSGALTARKVSGGLGETLRVDDTTYDVSDIYQGNDRIDGDWYSAATELDHADVDLDNDITAYLDRTGNVAMLTLGESGPDQIGYILGSEDDGLEGLRVKIALADGSTASHYVSDYEGDLSTGAATDESFSNGAVNGEFVLYSMDGNDIELTFLHGSGDDYDVFARADATDVYEFTQGRSTISYDTGAEKKYADDETLFFYSDNFSNDDLTLHVGMDDAPNMSIEDGVALATGADGAQADYTILFDGSDVAAVYVMSTESTVQGDDFLYIYDDLGETADGFEVLAIVNGELTTLTIEAFPTAFDGDEHADAENKFGVYTYSVSGDVYTLSDKPANTAVGTITHLSSNSIVVNGVEYDLNDADIATVSEGEATLEDNTAFEEGQNVVVIHDGDASTPEALAVYIIAEAP